MQRSAIAMAVFVLASAVSRAAWAQSPEDKALAQTLFDEAQTLIDKGQFAEACPKLAESQRRDPGLGTLLWLADCYENLGRTASAWAVFKEAAAVAAKQGDPRDKVARQRAATLEPKLSRLSIVVRTSTPGLVVERDGVTVNGAVLGSPIPIDPGRHVIRATASGKKPWEKTLEIAGAGTATTVEVPALEAEPSAPQSATTPVAESPTHDGRSQRTIGLVLGGVGVVALGVGAYFGANAASLKSDADAHCPNKACDREGSGLVSDAKTSATVSTVSLAVGALAVGAGAYFFFTAPRATASIRVAPAIAADGAGLQARGSW